MSKKTKIAKHKKKNTESLTLTHQEFSSPIPSPAILEQYQNILPTAPERIISMEENQQSHENKTVEKALNGEINHGQIYGFLLIVLIALLSTYALFLGYEKFAIMGMVFVAVPLVKIFILGSKNH